MGNCFSSEQNVNMDTAAGRAERAIQKKVQKSKESKNVQAEKFAASRNTGILVLTEAKLTEFPSVILDITKLKILDLSGNQLSSLPSNLRNLSNLKKLTLSNNRLQSLPTLEGLTSLELGIFDNNSITSVGSLPSNMKELSMSMNSLTTVPSSIQNMNNLVKLTLSKNSISGSLPGWIGSLPKLQIIEMDDNRIDRIDDAVGQTKTLQTLLLRRNKISSIPASLLKSPSLNRMRLEGNLITKQALMSADGFEEFDEKRRAALNKAISAGLEVDTSVCGLD